MKSYNDILKINNPPSFSASVPDIITEPEIHQIWEKLKDKYPSEILQRAELVSSLLPKKSKDFDIVDQILNIIADGLQDVTSEEDLGKLEVVISALKTIKKQQRILFANKTNTKISETVLIFLLNQLTKA